MARKRVLKTSDDPSLGDAPAPAAPVKPKPAPTPAKAATMSRSVAPTRTFRELGPLIADLVFKECESDHPKAVDRAMAFARELVRRKWTEKARADALKAKAGRTRRT